MVYLIHSGFFFNSYLSLVPPSLPPYTTISLSPSPIYFLLSSPMGSLPLEAETSKKKAMWLYPKVLGFNPSERWGHSACYSHGLVYVFGGCCGGLHFSDVLVLNLESMTWSTLATIGKGPGPRDSHTASLVGQRMIVFGGTNGCNKVNELHVLNLVTKEWMQPACEGTPPSPRESHTATLVEDEKLVVFGGSGQGEANYLNDLHVLDLKAMTWTSPEVKGDVPVPRDSHCTIAIGNKLVVYGGDCGDRYHGAVSMLDMDTMTWSRLAVQGSSPGVRAGHAAVNVGTKIYVIGGVGDKHYYNDVWVLDLSTCSWTQLQICGHQPQGRFSHTAVVTESDIAIYGGCGEDERPLNELLVLQLGAEHPNGRYNISMCKIFGKHWSQERRRVENNPKSSLLDGNARKPESEAMQSLGLSSGTNSAQPPKRRRGGNIKGWEGEAEQEEHSLSLSQHSSPSQSDQEQTPVQKPPDSQGFHLFKQMGLNNVAGNHRARGNGFIRASQDVQYLGERPKCEQFLNARSHFLPAEPKPIEPLSVHNLIGADVRGKVDGAFDSGLLMTATVNGKIFRGVLFTPGAGAMARGVAQPFPSSNSLSSQQAVKMYMPESGQKQGGPRPFPIVPKHRGDLQGVVLTLGGPASGQGGS